MASPNARLLVVLLIQVPFSFAALNCEFEKWTIDILECAAVGEKNNQLSLDTLGTLFVNDTDWNKIKTLILKDAKLLTIDKGFFEPMRLLQNLDLSGNRLLNIPQDAFKNMQNLQTLKLSGSSLFSEELSHLPDLKVLDASDLLINSRLVFTVQVFNTFNSLEILDLSNNDEIDFSVLKVQNTLRSLDVSHTRVVLDDQSFKDAAGLTSLVMSDAGLSHVSQKTFHQTPIRHLDLSNNSITDDSLSCLSDSMVHVNLSYNKIGSLNDPLAFKSKFQILDLSHNFIRYIHPRILYTTEKLYLLNLAYNQIPSIHYRMFYHFSNLETLDLSHNLLEDLPDSVFSNLDKLVSLNLGGNKLKTLQATMFEKNIALEVLVLSHNSLQTLNIRTFAHLNQLRTLDLRSNMLTRLPDELLDLRSLSELIVSCNRLTFLTAHFFEAASDRSGWKVFLQGNPWNCKCLESVIGALETYQYDQNYFNKGNHPSCFVGDNPAKRCEDQSLSSVDYAKWDQIVQTAGIKC